jgi:hypothetical protein
MLCCGRSVADDKAPGETVSLLGHLDAISVFEGLRPPLRARKMMPCGPSSGKAFVHELATIWLAVSTA